MNVLQKQLQKSFQTMHMVAVLAFANFITTVYVAVLQRLPLRRQKPRNDVIFRLKVFIMINLVLLCALAWFERLV